MWPSDFAAAIMADKTIKMLQGAMAEIKVGNPQFYATDSTKHFITGSIYFYAKPNFDSVMPASSYVRNDMQRLMETLKWK